MQNQSANQETKKYELAECHSITFIDREFSPARLGAMIVSDKADKEEERVGSLKFHIKSGDYFSTLAVVLDLIIQEQANMNKRHEITLRRLKNDLLFLHENYRIVKK